MGASRQDPLPERILDYFAGTAGASAVAAGAAETAGVDAADSGAMAGSAALAACAFLNTGALRSAGRLARHAADVDAGINAAASA